jgi:hypothetical protein
MKTSPLKSIESFVKAQKDMPHFTFVSVLIGVGVSAAAILTISALDGSLFGLFGQEAEAATKARSTRPTGTGTK